MPTDTIRIPHPNHFDFAQCMFYLDRGYDECLYQLENNSIIRAIHLGDRSALIRVENHASYLDITILQGHEIPRIHERVRAYVENWFDLPRDLTAFYRLLYQNPITYFLREKYRGLRLIGIPDLFEALCWCIIGQQINLTFAYKLKRRLVERYGEVIWHQQHPYYLFPTADKLRNANRLVLREMQFSRQKITYLLGIAENMASKTLLTHHLRHLPSMEERQKLLLNQKGIGIWTANYVTMKTFRDANSIPYGDAGLNKALRRLKVIDHGGEVDKIKRFFQPFDGWRSYLTFYLWRSLYD